MVIHIDATEGLLDKEAMHTLPLSAYDIPCLIFDKVVVREVLTPPIQMHTACPRLAILCRQDYGTPFIPVPKLGNRATDAQLLRSLGPILYGECYFRHNYTMPIILSKIQYS